MNILAGHSEGIKEHYVVRRNVQIACEEIDVGHVELGLFKPEHLKAIHAFVERAENAFREMLEILLPQVAAGKFEIAHHELTPPSDGALKVVGRLQE